MKNYTKSTIQTLCTYSWKMELQLTKDIFLLDLGDTPTNFRTTFPISSQMPLGIIEDFIK